jgi:hydrogenase nickel incorporation protein HypA/HybF
MHEYSIVQALYEKVAAEAAVHGAVSVHALKVRIGELSGVDRGLLETAWQLFRERTVCDAALLDIEVVTAEWVCSGCGADVARGAVLVCPSCGSPAKLRQGDEIVLERIELEVA